MRSGKIACSLTLLPANGNCTFMPAEYMSAIAFLTGALVAMIASVKSVSRSVQLQQEILADFPGAFIVNDEIELPELR